MVIKRLGDVVLIQLSYNDSNIYVIGDTVIDTGTGLNFTRLRDVFRIMKKDMDSVKEIINTHGHFDHIGGNGYFFNAKISIHEKDADIVEKGDEKRSVADFFDGKLHPKPVGRKLKHGDQIVIGGMTLEVIHTPGHTPGSICLYDRKQKILFSGDTVFSNGIGRVDLPGGSVEQMEETLNSLLDLEIEKIYPGHGDPVLAKGSAAIEKILKDGGGEDIPNV